MRPPHQSTTLSYANMSKMRPPYNSLHTTGVHYINHYTFSYTNKPKLRPPHNSIHFSNANNPKLRPLHNSLHFSNEKKKVKIQFLQTYQSLHFFLYKHVKTASHFLYTLVHYINQYTFFIPTVHHMISLHFSYTKVSKMRPPYESLHFFHTNCPLYQSLHFAYTLVHHINHYTFPYTNKPKLRPLNTKPHISHITHTKINPSEVDLCSII
jgi:ribosome-associated toxin RatA of RatAB toxin-antitoxin module